MTSRQSKPPKREHLKVHCETLKTAPKKHPKQHLLMLEYQFQLRSKKYLATFRECSPYNRQNTVKVILDPCPSHLLQQLYNHHTSATMMLNHRATVDMMAEMSERFTMAVTEKEMRN